jgi:hypothetical protein
MLFDLIHVRLWLEESSDMTPKSFYSPQPRHSHKDFSVYFTRSTILRYRCEISADAPSFGIVYSDQKMKVVGGYPQEERA